MSTFTHLHVASSFSAHFGTQGPEHLVAQAARDNTAGAQDGAVTPALALTDRDGLYGAIRHVRACLAEGVSPIVGVDLHVASRGDSFPVVILAHGSTAGAGWAALCRTISAAHSPRSTAALVSATLAPATHDATPRDTAKKPARPRADAPQLSSLELPPQSAPTARPSPAAGAAAPKHQRARPSVPTLLLPGFLRDEEHPLATVLLGPYSNVGQAVLHRRHDLARQLLAEWTALLPGGIAIEVVCHFTEPGEAASVGHAADLLELAEECRVPAVLTNAVRYAGIDDAATGDLLDSADQLLALTEFSPQPNGQAWLKPRRKMELVAQFIINASTLSAEAIPRLLAATERLAERCILDPVSDIGWGQPKLPELSALGLSGDPQRILAERCQGAISERYPRLTEAGAERVHRRLHTELSTISGFGFDSYFLTVADVSRLISGRGIRNQARGSGASSIVNYLLRVSAVDPLEHDLLFERFLGNQRSTLPDIDIDIESARRHEAYEAIFERYGKDRVTLLSMQNTYQARGAARDTGQALGLSDTDIDFIARNIWRFNARDFREALEAKPELAAVAELAAENPSVDMLVDLTSRLDHLPRHIAMHPCGVILGNADLLSRTPVQPSGMGLSMSQFDKDDIDDAGFLKLDLLGVRMQSSIAYAVNEIERVHGSGAAVAGGLAPTARYITASGRLDVDALPHSDEETFESIRSTHTLGMFQIESPGQRELIGKMQPDRYSDLIADISLFRPGPMKGNMIAPFIAVKHGEQQPDTLHPLFSDILSDSYGVVIYHEHILRILGLCMGIDLAYADELRRALGSCPERVEAEFRQRTPLQLAADGTRLFTDEDIDRIWAVVIGFGSFGFCKAHGAAFALPTYQTAWLKTHYPAPFLAAILEHDPGMYPKRLLAAEARRLGIPLLPVDVNTSSSHYHVEPLRVRTGRRSEPGDYGIRLSLASVQGVTAAELERIVTLQPFDTISDFARRAAPSKRLLQRLAAVGALDSLSPRATRGEVIAYTRSLCAPTPARRRALASQPPLGGEGEAELWSVDALEPLPPTEARDEQTRVELDVLGYEVTDHLIESYRPLLDSLGVTPANEVVGLPHNTEVLVAGIRVATQTPPMRSGKRVVFISLDDGSGCADVTFFGEAQKAAGSMLFGTKLMVVAGTTRRSGAKGISIQATKVWDLAQLWSGFATQKGA